MPATTDPITPADPARTLRSLLNDPGVQHLLPPNWKCRALAAVDAMTDPITPEPARSSRFGWADALRWAADEFDRADLVTIEDVEVGSNMVPVAPAERLRIMADELEMP